MKRKLLVFVLFAGLGMSAQCTIPPPPGYWPYYVLDNDSDGIAVFDMQFFIDYTLKPNLEQSYGVSADGYNYVFHGSAGVVPAPAMYTNVEPGEFTSIEFVYSGSGPTFDPQPPCFWPVDLGASVRLWALASGDDQDGDGIANINEDTNGNGNFMDDDDDSDGVWNVLDTTNSLSISEAIRNNLKIYPNPVVNDQITFQSDVPISSVTAYDSLGREVLAGKPNGNVVKLNGLAAGTYLLKFQSQEAVIFRKILIK